MNITARFVSFPHYSRSSTSEVSTRRQPTRQIDTFDRSLRASATNSNLVACRNFRPDAASQTEILRIFPRTRLIGIENNERVKKAESWFSYGLLPTTEYRWYSLPQLAQSLFEPMDLTQLPGLVVAGAQTPWGPDFEKLFYTGKVLSVSPSRTAGKNPVHDVSIQLIGKGLPEEVIQETWMQGADYLYEEAHRASLYFLGPPCSNTDVFRAVLNGTDFLPVFQSFTDNHPAVQDINVMLAVLNLIIELPPSFKASAIVKILHGQEIKFNLRADLREKYYGMVKGIKAKQGRGSRYPKELIQNMVAFFSGDYRHGRGLFERLELQITEEPSRSGKLDYEETAPDWISHRRLDKDAARVLVDQLEALKGRPEIEKPA